MSDPATLLTIAGAGTAAVGIAAAAGLKGWQEWLEVRRMEIASGRRGRGRAARPDLMELRERVRRLESIANGADN